jgi:acylphosphatase
MGAIEIRVTGRVQGVGFRAWAASRARNLRLTGWVRNAEDGSVEIHAEGPDDSLERFLGALREGSPYSSVDGVVSRRVDARGYRGFDIAY